MKNFKGEKIILILLAFNRDSFEPGNALKIYGKKKKKKTHHLTLPSPTTYGSSHFIGEDSGAQSRKRLAQAHKAKPGAGARDGPSQVQVNSQGFPAAFLQNKQQAP